jgi:hypothetical protein
VKKYSKNGWQVTLTVFFRPSCFDKNGDPQFYTSLRLTDDAALN